MKPISGAPLLTVSSPPHFHCGRSIKGDNLQMTLALLPAVAFAVWHFGIEATRVLALGPAVAILAEAVSLKAMKRHQEADNYSALLCGLMLSFLLPASSPWWLVAVGSAASIIAGKMIFGGLGANPLCPPLVGWAICKISWPDYMDFDLTMLSSELTYPLSQIKNFGLDFVSTHSVKDLLMGFQLGGVGTAQVGAVMAGGLYLIVRRQIRPEIPLSFLAGLTLTALLYNLAAPETYAGPMIHLLSGSTIFGAFFLATDGASSPVGRIPMIAFGATAGIMTMIIRIYGMYPDGVPFAILLANLITPLFEKIRPKPFGGEGRIYFEGQL